MTEALDNRSAMEARVDKTMMQIDQDLPTIPVVLSQIMHLTASNQASVGDLIAVLNQDQALTARVLRVANSAYYAMREKVTTIDRAVVILGFDMVRSLAAGASFINYFSPKNRFEGFDLNAFWSHATAVGVFAQIIAEEIHLEESSDAFTAGIMHDIGKLVMLIYFEDEFGRILNRVAEDRLDFFQAEMVEIGMSHSEIAGKLLKRWNIPDVLALAISHHHEVHLAEEDIQVAACLNLADFAAQYIKIGNSGSPYLKPPTMDTLRAVDLKTESFKAILKKLASKKSEVFKLISALD